MLILYHEAVVLFDVGRFPDAQDLLDCAIDGEPWCEAETMIIGLLL